jgi:hypothetical protein
MHRTLLSGLVLALVWAGTAQAQHTTGSHWNNFHAAYYQNKMWPDPYVLPDRMTIPNTMAVFIDRGWQRQCLLGEHHFNDQKQLSTAGQMRVHYIMSQAAPDRRTIYVEQGLSQDVTRWRIDAVQQYMTALVPNGTLPNVVASNLVSEGWSAEYVDNVNRKFYSSMPTPRLQNASGGGSSSGGSGQ